MARWIRILVVLSSFLAERALRLFAGRAEVASSVPLSLEVISLSKTVRPWPLSRNSFRPLHRLVLLDLAPTSHVAEASSPSTSPSRTRDFGRLVRCGFRIFRKTRERLRWDPIQNLLQNLQVGGKYGLLEKVCLEVWRR